MRRFIAAACKRPGSGLMKNRLPRSKFGLAMLALAASLAFIDIASVRLSLRWQKTSGLTLQVYGGRLTLMHYRKLSSPGLSLFPHHEPFAWTFDWDREVPGYLFYFAAVPLWLPIVASAASGAALVYRARHRPNDGTCPGCGYDLTGITTTICPECGTTVTPTPTLSNSP
jgi:hypothetical protein